MKKQPEQWKAIAECNGEYYISDHGQVKSYKFGKERILKPNLMGLLGNQYLFVALMINSQKSNRKLHRLVALAFIPNPENKPQVNHKDGNKLNNCVDNLEWATAKENTQHAWKNGLNEHIRVSRFKPVVDIITGEKYVSLTQACENIKENYFTHGSRIFSKSKRQRFFYINDNGNG